MWIYFLLLLLLLYLAKFYYKSVYLTKKQMKRYKAQFQKAGYKVKEEDFKLFLSAMITQMREGQSKHNNPFYYFEQQHPSYDVVVYSMLNKPSIVLINPDLIQQFFNKNPDCYKKMDLIVQGVSRALGKGLFFSQDDAWKKKRKILSSAFHYSWIKELTPRILKTADVIFDKFQEKSKSQNPMKMVLLQEFQKLFSSVMLKFFFGYEGKQIKLENQQPSLFVNGLMMQMRQQTISIWFLLFGSKFFEYGFRKIDRDINRKIQVFKQFALNIVSSRVKQLKQNNFKRQDKQSGDLLEELFLSNSLNANKNEDTFDHQELVEEFCGFFLAGTETSALLVTMTIIYLHQHPQFKEKIQKQIEKYIKSDDDYNDDNLQNLEFTTACLKQTLRYYGPSNSILIRQVSKQNKLKQVKMTEGTLINPIAIGNHFNSTYFKDPYKWNPQRWLNENKTLPHAHIFMPFSSGRRNCIGQHLAMTQSKIVLARFLQRYNYDIKDEIVMKMVFMVAPVRFNTLLTKK